MKSKMKKVIIIMAVLCMVMSSLSSGLLASGDSSEAVSNMSLILNGSFEETEAGDVKSLTDLKWSIRNTYDTKSYEAVIDNNEAKSGSKSLKISSTEGGGAVKLVISQEITGLITGKTYKLSGWIKLKDYFPSGMNNDGPCINAYVKQGSTTIKTGKVSADNKNNTTDWTPVEYIFDAVHSDIRIDCVFNVGTGTAWFDDLRLEEFVPVTRLELNKDRIELKPNESFKLNAVIYPDNATNSEIEWKSSNSSVATVDKNGNVTAGSGVSGTAIISAIIKDGRGKTSSHAKRVGTSDVEAVCKVTVKGTETPNELLEEIRFNKNAVNMRAGAMPEYIHVIYKPADTAHKDLVWSSSNPEIAIVNDGYVIGLSPGSAVIKATSKKDKNIFAEINVNVTEAAGSTASDKDTIIEFEPDPEFDEKLKKSEHPKILFDYGDLDSMRKKVREGWIAETYRIMTIQAEKYLREGAKTHSKSAGGGRVLHCNVSNLAMTGYIEKDMRYINRAIDLLVSSAKEYTIEDYHYLNSGYMIAPGDALHAYVMGYDWLEPFMTESEKELIMEKIEGLGDLIYTKGNLRKTLPDVSSNHNSVPAGALGMAALLLGDKPDWLEKAKEQVIGYYQTSTDSTGFNGESLGYYCYGALGGHTFAAALNRVYPDIDIEKEHANSELVMDMIMRYTKPVGGSFITIGDTNDLLYPSGNIIYIISKYKMKEALWNFLKLFDNNQGDGSYGSTGSTLGASAPYIIIWADPELKPEKPKDDKNALNKFFEWGYGVFRSGWDALDALVTFTSGYTPHRGHNQRDENSFTFTAFGEDFAIDPAYTPTESISHNTIMVDGYGQERISTVYDVYGKTLETKEFDEGNAWYMKGEAIDCYPDVIGLESITRQFLYGNGKTPYVLIVDDIIKKDNDKSTYTWLLNTETNNMFKVNPGIISGAGSRETEADVEIIGGNTGAVLHIKFLWQDDPVIRLGNLRDRLITGGARGDYKMSSIANTMEAIFTGGKTTRIVSLLAATDADGAMPEISYTGSPEDGVITIKFKDGTKDTIKLGATSIDAFERSSTGTLKKVLIYGGGGLALLLAGLFGFFVIKRKLS